MPHFTSHFLALDLAGIVSKVPSPFHHSALEHSLLQHYVLEHSVLEHSVLALLHPFHRLIQKI